MTVVLDFSIPLDLGLEKLASAYVSFSLGEEFFLAYGWEVSTNQFFFFFFFF